MNTIEKLKTRRAVLREQLQKIEQRIVIAERAEQQKEQAELVSLIRKSGLSASDLAALISQKSQTASPAHYQQNQNNESEVA